MSIINKLKKLDQKNFKAQIVEDTYYFNNLSIGNGTRTAIFKCGSCHAEYCNAIGSEKLKNQGHCESCYQRIRYEDFHRKKEDIAYLRKHGSVSGRKSDFFGVRQNRYNESFVAIITVNKYQITIGTYDTVEEAAYYYDMYVKNSYLDRQLNKPIKEQ